MSNKFKMFKYCGFGEIMMRLSPPKNEVILQSPTFDVSFGGSEANFLASVSNYGGKAHFISVIPDNQLGDEALRYLNSHGIECAHVRRTAGRMGIYYAEKGASLRPSKVIYDREFSSFSSVGDNTFDWNKIFEDKNWFHISGITPALTENLAGSSLRAMKKAKENKLGISCDLNYRSKLWKWGRSPVEIMPDFVRLSDVLIANEEDCQKSLGLGVKLDITKNELDLENYKRIINELKSKFPNLKHIAITLRESISADWNNWSAILASKDKIYLSKKYEIHNIVDRIGAGDAFSGSLIWGLNNLENDQEALEFAVAASALKHTIYGDFNRVTINDVKNLVDGNLSGRVQR